MRYQPLADRIIVQAAEENRRTPGGLFVPDVAMHQRHVAYGTVLSVGTGRVNAEGKTVPLSVKVGDCVAFGRKAPGLLPIIDEDGTETTVLLLREADVVAIVHDLPRATGILDVAGAPLSMVPTSKGLPDSVYENREGIEIAEREGWEDVGEHEDQPT